MTDYFSLLGLARSYSLDATELERAYTKAMAACHPDKHHQNPLFAVGAQQITAEINQAYQTLSQPLERARHLLALVAGQSDSDDKTIADPQWLFQQMQWNEKLDQATPDEREAISSDIANLNTQEQESIARAFASQPIDIAAIKVGIIRMSYYQKLLERWSTTGLDAHFN